MSEQTVPTISLAGREWEIPTLAPKQNRIVVPALLQLVPKILRARDEAAGAGRLLQLAQYLDTETYDRLTDLVFAALTRASPNLARADFDELPIDTLDLIASLAAIARAAGLIRSAP